MRCGQSSEKAIVAIPAFDPPAILCRIVREIRSLDPQRKILVFDDGSRKAESVFSRIRSDFPDVILLKHDRNEGKGQTLKDIIRFVPERFPDTGIVFADCDGQHLPEDILKAASVLERGGADLVLGVRDFSLPGIPLRNRFGNKLTGFLFNLLTGRKIADTQSGLRGISSGILPELPDLPGKRYEFETEMLLTAADRGWKTEQIPVATVYSDCGNSHFRPLADSFRIGLRLLKYCFTSRRP